MKSGRSVMHSIVPRVHCPLIVADQVSVALGQQTEIHYLFTISLRCCLQ